MEEKVLSKSKNGMPVLLGIIAGMLICVGLFIASIASENPFTGAISVILFVILCILPAGLKVLKPQEALVLTLFGKYVGTLKDDGFYFVNPFCVAVNPAAKTKLSQSGDVNKPSTSVFLQSGTRAETEMVSRKISLKMMTLNNAVQKLVLLLSGKSMIHIKQYLM